MERPNFSQIFHETVGVGIAQVRDKIASQELTQVKETEKLTQVVPPYVDQLAGAKPDLIENRYGNIKDSAAARRFGASDADEFSYWAWRSCGIAGVEMVVKAHKGSGFTKTTMDLVREGLELGGYDIDKDRGWFHNSLRKLANKYDVPCEVKKFIPPNELALSIRDNKYVLASIKSELGGHLLLLYGFRLNNEGQLEGFVVHDPNGFSQNGKGKFIEKSKFDELTTRRALIFTAPNKP